jgi:hypothetical protein
MLGSERPLNEQEREEMGKYKLLPCLATETTAAQFVLLTSTIPQTVALRAVLDTPNKEDGARATTDDTIKELLTFLEGSQPAMLFSLNQPYASRMMLVIDRILSDKGYAGQCFYVANSPIPKPGMSEFVPDDNFVSRLIDEACKLLYEIKQRFEPAVATA